MQCCTAVRASWRKQQRPQLGMEGRGEVWHVFLSEDPIWGQCLDNFVSDCKGFLKWITVAIFVDFWYIFNGIVSIKVLFLAVFYLWVIFWNLSLIRYYIILQYLFSVQLAILHKLIGLKKPLQTFTNLTLSSLSQFCGSGFAVCRYLNKCH